VNGNSPYTETHAMTKCPRPMCPRKKVILDIAT
jgi:hypothetical protein